jgi:hypothetical protein
MQCPKCAGEMFDETKSKFWNGGKTKDGKPKPMWKCKDKASCDGVVWGNAPAAPARASDPEPEVNGAAGKEKLAAMFRLYDQCVGHAVTISNRIAVKQSTEKMPALNLDVAAMAATLYIQANMKGIAL